MRLGRAHAPVVITGAPPDPQAEFDYRRRRYAITMGIRVVCLLIAAAAYRIIWLWPIFAAAAIVLPWVAVLLANDRLPQKSSRFQRYAGAAAPAIEPARGSAESSTGPGPTIDAAAEDPAENPAAEPNGSDR